MKFFFTGCLVLLLSLLHFGGVNNLPKGDVLNSAESQVVPYGIPAGTILPFAGTVAPGGFILCHGQSLSRVQYGGLFRAIGTAFGSADANSFNAPDFRGRFLRGADLGAGLDPYAASRVAMNPGGNTGNNVGSVLGHTTARPTYSAFTTNTDTHSHTIPWRDIGATSSGSFSIGRNEGGATDNKATTSDGHSHSVSAGGDAETAPKSAYVNYIIKL